MTKWPNGASGSANLKYCDASAYTSFPHPFFLIFFPTFLSFFVPFYSPISFFPFLFFSLFVPYLFFSLVFASFPLDCHLFIIVHLFPCSRFFRALARPRRLSSLFVSFSLLFFFPVFLTFVSLRLVITVCLSLSYSLYLPVCLSFCLKLFLN